MSLQQTLKGWPGPLSARNRPNSLAEWVLGCNLPAPFNLPGQGAAPEFAAATAHLRGIEVSELENPVTPPAVVPPAREEKEKQPMAQPVIRSGRTTPTGKDLRLQLEVYADSLDQTDTMTITLPRPGSVPPMMSSVAPGMIPTSMPTTVTPILPAAVYKKVAFVDDLKSALKSPRVIELSAGSSESDSDSESCVGSSDESSDSDERDKSRRRKSRHRVKHKHSHHVRRSRSHSCPRRPRTSSHAPCDCGSDDFLRDALKGHRHIYDRAERRYAHHGRGKECELDDAWSEDDDPFYRFADSETLHSEGDERTKSQAPAKKLRPKATQPAQTVTKETPAEEQARRSQSQTCLPVPVPVYYPVGIESGKRQAYGPSMPWKSGPVPAPDRRDREPVCLQCRTMQLQGLPQMTSPVFNDSRPRFHQDIASDSSGRASNGTDRYYYWTQQPERKQHARSRSVTCNRDLEYPPGWIPSPKEWHSGGANYGYYHYVPESPMAHHRELEYPPGWQPSGREWHSGAYGCYHHRTPEPPPMHHREMDYAYKPRYPPPPEYNTVRYGYQHHPHVTVSPARSLGRTSNSTKSYFGNSRYPIPGAWYDPPEAEHKLRDDYKRHRMEVYRREQERLEKERARLDRRQSQEQERRQAKRHAKERERERESSPPPVWGDTSAAQSRHKSEAGQNTDVAW